MPISLRPSIFSRDYIFSRILTHANRLLAVLAFALSSNLHAEPLRVNVVLSEPGGAYQIFGESLRTKMESSDFRISFSRAGEKTGEGDIFIAVGMKAAAELAARDVPVLNVFVPKSGNDRLQKESGKRSKPYSAIYLDQPPERQIALLRAVLPAARNVGVLYSNPPQELLPVRNMLADAGMLLHEQKLDQQRTLNDALEGVLEGSDVLMVLPDPVIYNPGTIRNILLTAYRKQIPLIGISQAYVKAGALCAVFSTPEQIADKAAVMIRRFIESGRLPAAQYPSAFEVAVNMQVARSLDIHIKDATQLRDEIRGVP